MIETSEYKSYFDKAFPEIDILLRYSEHYAGPALAAYERTVLANDVTFQNWMLGDKSSMTENET